MVFIVIGLGTLLGAQGPAAETTVTDFTSTSGCLFPVHELDASSTTGASFSGCLTPGASGSYLIAAMDPNGMTLSAVISSQYPVQVTIQGAPVGGLYPSAGLAYSVNGTTSATPSGIVLLPQSGYAVTIKNEGGQNNTVSLSIQLNDIPGGRQ